MTLILFLVFIPVISSFYIANHTDYDLLARIIKHNFIACHLGNIRTVTQHAGNHAVSSKMSPADRAKNAQKNIVFLLPQQ